MSSAASPHWRELEAKRQLVERLLACQARVLATAMGLSTPASEQVVRLAADVGAATAASASSSGGGGAGTAAGPGGMSGVAAFASATASALTEASPVDGSVPDAGRTALDGDEAQRITADAACLVEEMPYWGDGAALHAWLLLRAGRMSACSAACAKPAHAEAFMHDAEQHGISHAGDGAEWRWWLLAQLSWHRGDVAAAVEHMQEGMQRDPLAGAVGAASLLLPMPTTTIMLLDTAERLLAARSAGNDAFGRKQYEAALEHYSAGLSLCPSAGFAALLHNNRAASLSALGRHAEALADTARAVALDAGYLRAYLRWVSVCLCVLLSFCGHARSSATVVCSNGRCCAGNTAPLLHV